MSPETIKAAIVAAIAVSLLALGATGGWLINGWRLGGELERRQGVIDTQKQGMAELAGANQRCTAGVTDVKGAVKALVDDAARRSEAAAAAMQEAADRARGHEEAAKAALGRVQPRKGQECATAAAEASAYVRKRRGQP